jgi:hypothetical protein
MFRTPRLPKEFDGLFFQLAENRGQGEEEAIFWLRDPRSYPLYLRCNNWVRCGEPYRIGVRDALQMHIVAIAVHSFRGSRYHPYFRRFWFVKSYDAFHGHSRYQSKDPANPGWYCEPGQYPAEAVSTHSIGPNQNVGWGGVEGVRDFDRNFDYQNLRWGSSCH